MPKADWGARNRADIRLTYCIIKFSLADSKCNVLILRCLTDNAHSKSVVMRKNEFFRND